VTAAAAAQLQICIGGRQMHIRQLMFATLAAGLLAAPSPAAGVECPVCERRLVDCRAPAQAKFVACMNDQKSNCSVKCANHCKDRSEVQRCTVACVRSCEDAGQCRKAFNSATFRCGDEYQTCKRDCTIPTPPRQ
jgi:hypothetical protein